MKMTRKEVDAAGGIDAYKEQWAEENGVVLAKAAGAGN
jgi:hypothetical protein